MHYRNAKQTYASLQIKRVKQSSAALRELRVSLAESDSAHPMRRELRVLLIDGEKFFAEGVVKALSCEPGLRIFLLSSQKWIPLRLSNRVHRVIHCAAGDDGAMLEFLRTMAARHRIDLVMACAVPGISFLSRNFSAVTSFVRCAAVPSVRQLEIANDKWLTAVELSCLQIPIPRTMLLGLEAAEIGFPLIVKPRQGANGEGIFVVHLQKELDDALERIGERRQEYIVQSFIAGSDIGCSVLCRDGCILASTVQRPADCCYADFRPSHEIVLEHVPDVVEIARVTFGRLAWNGVANVDMRRTDSGEIYVIEINPRYWASFPASLAAGVNFARLAFLDSQGESFTAPEYKKYYYCEPKVWLKNSSLKRPLPLPASILFRLSDPLPFIWRICIKLLLSPAKLLFH
jgi:predicted ATP-grasp superfamily ATP-dependent carboligase